MISASTTDGRHSRQSRSPFATTLKELIEDTEIFSRSEWATTLGVTRAAISQWTTDKTVPRPRTLRSLIEVVRRYRGDDDDHLKSFLSLVDKPAHEVSPHGDRLGITVGRYLVSPVLEGLLRQLDTLPYSALETALENAVAECERLKEASEQSQHRVEQRDFSVVNAAPATAVHPMGSEPFIGRDTELAQVRNLLFEGTPVALLGATGAGKTALAGEVVRRLFGSAPCQAIRRFEFKKFHDLPWTELRQSLGDSQETRAAHARQTEHHRAGWPHDHQSVLFVFDDVDLARSQQRDALAAFLRECADFGPRLKVIVTYDSDRGADGQSLLSSIRHGGRLSTVYLSRLKEGDIAQIWIASLVSLSKSYSENSLRYATWLSAGSPGYCRQLVERARACTATDLPITEYDVVEASRLLLGDTEGGFSALDALNAVSRRAQSVAVWSAMQDLTAEAEEAGLPQFYRAVNEPAPTDSRDLYEAIEEAERHNLIESVTIGDKPAINLKNESHRPHFRSMALTRFKNVPPALITAGGS
ncbi:MAG: ATP-binding protein [Rhodospirillaceae bacterium]